MRAIIFDIDGTLIESMAVDTELYFGAITEVLGAVRLRNLVDYEHVTDNGILAQVLADNGHDHDPSVMAAIKALFVSGIRAHIESVGPFSEIHGATGFFDRVRASDDVSVAVATGGWRESASLKLASAGFDLGGIPLLTSDDAHARVDIMQLALREAGDRVESVTYFGDAEWDRRACEELGWEFVAVGPNLDGIETYDGFDL